MNMPAKFPQKPVENNSNSLVNLLSENSYKTIDAMGTLTSEARAEFAAEQFMKHLNSNT
jgi:hypothetical protein